MIRSMDPSRPRRAAVTLFAVATVIVAIDQVTKALVVSNLREGESRRVIDGAVSWTLQRNPGSAFGLFRHFPVVFTVLAALIALAIVVRAQRVHDRLTAVALGLVLGGALGNLVDRIARPPGAFRGWVIDLIDFHWWPVFNVADSAVVIGAALLLISSYRAERRAKARERTAA
ncbi:MAG TPA: signal peptidase II [Actinomycetota bacterium]|nr:signal peptidase II [Actinomycetota bacterium]